MAGTPTLDQLHGLQERVRLATGRPAEVERERERSLGAVEDARLELQGFYADGGKPDSARERELVKALEQAEQVAAGRWDDRLQGARLGVRRAREAARVFIAENFDQLAGELVPRALAAGEELREVEARLAEVRGEHECVLREWVPLLGVVGIARSDLPEFDSSEPPMPRSLLAEPAAGAGAGGVVVDEGGDVEDREGVSGP